MSVWRDHWDGLVQWEPKWLHTWAVRHKYRARDIVLLTRLLHPVLEGHLLTKARLTKKEILVQHT